MGAGRYGPANYPNLLTGLFGSLMALGQSDKTQRETQPYLQNIQNIPNPTSYFPGQSSVSGSGFKPRESTFTDPSQYSEYGQGFFQLADQAGVGSYHPDSLKGPWAAIADAPTREQIPNVLFGDYMSRLQAEGEYYDRMFGRGREMEQTYNEGVQDYRDMRADLKGTRAEGNAELAKDQSKAEQAIQEGFDRGQADIEAQKTFNQGQLQQHLAQTQTLLQDFTKLRDDMMGEWRQNITKAYTDTMTATNQTASIRQSMIDQSNLPPGQRDAARQINMQVARHEANMAAGNIRGQLETSLMNNQQQMASTSANFMSNIASSNQAMRANVVGANTDLTKVGGQLGAMRAELGAQTATAFANLKTNWNAQMSAASANATIAANNFAMNGQTTLAQFYGQLGQPFVQLMPYYGEVLGTQWGLDQQDYNHNIQQLSAIMGVDEFVLSQTMPFLDMAVSGFGAAGAQAASVGMAADAREAQRENWWQPVAGAAVGSAVGGFTGGFGTGLGNAAFNGGAQIGFNPFQSKMPTTGNIGWNAMEPTYGS